MPDGDRGELAELDARAHAQQVLIAGASCSAWRRPPARLDRAAHRAAVAERDADPRRRGVDARGSARQPAPVSGVSAAGERVGAAPPTTADRREP